MRRMPATPVALAAIILSTGHAHAQQRRKPVIPPRVQQVPANAAQSISATGVEALTTRASVPLVVGPEYLAVARIINTRSDVFKAPCPPDQVVQGLVMKYPPIATWCNSLKQYMSYGAPKGIGWIITTLRNLDTDEAVKFETRVFPINVGAYATAEQVTTALGTVRHIASALRGDDIVILRVGTPGRPHAGTWYTTFKDAKKNWYYSVSPPELRRILIIGRQASGVKTLAATDETGAEISLSDEELRSSLNLFYEYSDFSPGFIPGDKRVELLILHLPRMQDKSTRTNPPAGG